MVSEDCVAFIDERLSSNLAVVIGHIDAVYQLEDSRSSVVGLGRSGRSDGVDA